MSSGSSPPPWACSFLTCKRHDTNNRHEPLHGNVKGAHSCLHAWFRRLPAQRMIVLVCSCTLLNEWSPT
jgi:hypothetical protein